MRITILPGAVPATTFIDALINTMDEIGHDITVVGKKTGDYKYNKKSKRNSCSYKFSWQDRFYHKYTCCHRLQTSRCYMEAEQKRRNVIPRPAILPAYHKI